MERSPPTPGSPTVTSTRRTRFAAPSCLRTLLRASLATLPVLLAPGGAEATVGTAGPAAAAGSASGSAARAVRAVPAQSSAISLDQAVDLVQRRYGAKVVRTEVVDERGRRTYVLRLLSADGRVWTVRVDAASGAVSE
jgi:hypothetical protein